MPRSKRLSNSTPNGRAVVLNRREACQTRRIDNQSRFDILPYLNNDQKIWREAATHFARLRQAGITIPWNDALVATLALQQDCRVYAVDQHFEAMQQHLNLRLYKPGYNGSFQAKEYQCACQKIAPKKSNRQLDIAQTFRRRPIGARRTNRKG